MKPFHFALQQQNVWIFARIAIFLERGIVDNFELVLGLVCSDEIMRIHIRIRRKSIQWNDGNDNWYVMQIPFFFIHALTYIHSLKALDTY